MPDFGGQYTITDPPQRVGVFINQRTVVLPRVRAGAAGVVAVVGEADWGPVGEVVEITSPAQALRMFDSGQGLYFAIEQALLGEGLLDRSGAASVLAYRVAGSAAAAATLTLQNATPASAITVTAKYKGVRGNSFRITTQTNALDNTKRELIVYEGSVPLETYIYDASGATILASLVAEINSRSNYITAAVVTDAAPLAPVVSSALTGGNSGETTTTADHVAAMAALEANAQFDVFALDDWITLSSEVQDTYTSWATRLLTEGKLFHTVVGGALGESTATAIARSEDLDTPATGVLGVGEAFVNLTRDLIVNGVTYSSSRMAPRIAGIIAAADYNRSISNAILTSASVANPPSAAQQEALVRGGVLAPYVRGQNVYLQRGVTTYGVGVAPTDEKSRHYRDIIFNRKLWRTFDQMNDLVFDKLVGKKITNTKSTRETILGMFQDLLKTFEEDENVIPGAEVRIDESQPNDDTTLYLLFTYRPAPTVEQVLAVVAIPV